MQKFTPEAQRIEAVSALDVVRGIRALDRYGAYVGLDVHKETIAIAVAEPGRSDPVYQGEIPNKAKTMAKLIQRLSRDYDGERLLFCYEAGPCGYVLYHQIRSLGHDCDVVAPALIPRKAGDRVKTDRRDALGLARQCRSGDLTAVWVPDKEQEAMRDLTRAREDMKQLQQKARQQLGAFLLRHGKQYTEGKKNWTQRHFRWLETVKFEQPVQQIVFQEYMDAVKEAQVRVAGLGEQLHTALAQWSLRPVAEALVALRGVDVITAMTVLAELGDLTRFDSPRQLMAFLGLVPSEHSSGGRRRQGAITKAGNGHARRVLVESAWSYRFPARKTAHLRRKAAKASGPVQAIAWQAQKRLCGRYRQLIGLGKVKQQVTTAIARELAGFIWAISCEVMGKAHNSRAVVQ